MSLKAKTELGAFAKEHYGVFGEQFPGTTRIELQQGKRRVLPAWKQPPAAHALGSLTPYKEAYVAWNGAAAPPQPEGGRVLVAAPAPPVMEFTTATMRRPLPSTAPDAASAGGKAPPLPPGEFRAMGLGAGRQSADQAGNKAWKDTKNMDHFASAPGATTGYNSFKTPGDWVP